jgi:hypothetical protein
MFLDERHQYCAYCGQHVDRFVRILINPEWSWRSTAKPVRMLVSAGLARSFNLRLPARVLFVSQLGSDKSVLWDFETPDPFSRIFGGFRTPGEAGCQAGSHKAPNSIVGAIVDFLVFRSCRSSCWRVRFPVGFVAGLRPGGSMHPAGCGDQTRSERIIVARSRGSG